MKFSRVKFLIYEQILKELEDDKQDPYYSPTAKEEFTILSYRAAMDWKKILEDRPAMYRSVLQNLGDDPEKPTIQMLMSKIITDKITTQEAEMLQDYVYYDRHEPWENVRNILLRHGYKRINIE
jgi:hypothetical protein